MLKLKAIALMFLTISLFCGCQNQRTICVDAKKVYNVEFASEQINITDGWDSPQWAKTDPLEIKCYMGDKPDYIPDNQYFGMDTLIKALLHKQIEVCKYEMSEYWLDIGRLEDYDKAQDIYNKHFK